MATFAWFVPPKGARSILLIALLAGCGDSGGGTGPDRVAVASIELTPNTADLPPGQNQQLTWTLKDAAGNILTGRIVSFTTSNPVAATVSTRGLVSALGVGTATITATSEGKTATASINVADLPVTAVHITPGSANIGAGLAGQLFC